MSYYSPSMILKSICTALKIYHLMNELKASNKIFDEINQENRNANNIQRVKTNQIVEKNIVSSRRQDKKVKGGFSNSIKQEEEKDEE